MKRKSLIAVVVSAACVLMALVMILPMSVMAADAEPEYYVIADTGYVSDWIGSKEATAAYAHWVASDNQYSGVWQWSSEYNNVTYDAVEGTITFKETSNPSLKFHPAQAKNALGQGSCYLSFEVYVEKGKSEVEGNEKHDFSGIRFAYVPGDMDNVVFAISGEGKAYIGNTPEMNPSMSVAEELDEGWNKIEIVMLSMDKDGNVLESSNGEPYQVYEDKNGNGQYDEGVDGKKTNNPKWPVAKTNIYIRFSSETSPKAETRAFDFKALNADWHKLENFNCKNQFYNQWGASGYLRPYHQKEGSFSIRNSTAYHLNIESEINQYTYEGYDNLVQGVGANSANKNLTVPTAMKADSEEPVNFWYNEENNIFLKPGDNVLVTGSMHFTVATGEDESRGALKAAIDRVNLNALSTYTYAGLLYEKENIEAASIAADLGATHEFEILKESVLSEVEGQMATIADACEDLISNIGTIVDENEELQTRADTYLAMKEYKGDLDDPELYPPLNEGEERVKFNLLDKTYSEEAAEAIDQLNAFEQLWVTVEASYLAYQQDLEAVELEEPGPNKNLIYARIVENYSKIAMAYQTFPLADSVKEGYEENMNAMKEQYDGKASIVTKYTFLVDWAEDWNNFNRTAYFGRAEKIPDKLVEAIEDYNNLVKVVNNEFYEAAVMLLTLEQGNIQTQVGSAMISDIRSKVDKLYKSAYPEK